MDVNTLISVIVPVYNVEKYLKRSIDSIINQTYKNMEIILVDDGSTDNSGCLCDQYAQFDKRIKVIHKKNAGLGMARNSGLDVAKGIFVTFIDSDDYIGKTRIQRMLDIMVKTQADTCMTGFTKEFSKDNIVEHQHVEKEKEFVHDKIMKDILPKMCGAIGSDGDYIEMSVCMVMFSNKLIQNNSLRFASERKFISEDLVFDLEYYPLAQKVCVTNTTDYFYCHNEESLTTKYRPDRFQNQVILYKTILNKSKELGIENVCKPRLQNTLVSIARYSIKLEEKFSKDNGKKVACNNIKALCELDTTGFRRASKSVNYLMKHEMIIFLMLTMKVKNKFNI